MLELKLEETERTNDAKAEEIIRLEDELREMKSELNAAQATCENVQQNVSTGTSRFEMLLFGCEWYVDYQLKLQVTGTSTLKSELGKEQAKLPVLFQLVSEQNPKTFRALWQQVIVSQLIIDS